jgi:hypothetical protein
LVLGTRGNEAASLPAIPKIDRYREPTTLVAAEQATGNSNVNWVAVMGTDQPLPSGQAATARLLKDLKAAIWAAPKVRARY